MANSKISICNIALASVGADPIRAFDENNKRSRMCETMYETTKEYLLSKYHWTFARTSLKLQPISVADDAYPDNEYPYGLPNDCRTPIDIYPEGSRDPWRVEGNILICKKSPEEGVYLYYTKSVIDVAAFTEPFVYALSVGIAVRICPPITQNVKLTRALAEQYRMAVLDCEEIDANIGSEYRAADERPENDNFVNPGFSEEGF